MFSSSSRRRVILVISVLLGIGMGVEWQLRCIAQKSPEYNVQAKLVRGTTMYCGSDDWMALPAEFYTNMVESLESEELKRRAWERLVISNPDLTKTHIKIEVRRTRGSAIFTFLATGSELRGTRIFLDALLDEFIAWRKSVVEVAADRALHAFLQTATRSHEMEPPSVILERFLSIVETASRRGDPEVVAPYLETLHLPLKDLSGQTRPEDGGKTAPDHTTNLDQNVRELEARVHSYLSEAAALLRTTEKQALEQGPHQKQFEQLELFTATFFAIDPTQIAIQERASVSTEYVEDSTPPIALSACGGGLMGGLIGLVLSLLLVRSPKPPQIPAAVG